MYIHIVVNSLYLTLLKYCKHGKCISHFLETTQNPIPYYGNVQCMMIGHTQFFLQLCSYGKETPNSNVNPGFSQGFLYAGPNYYQSHMFWWTHGC